MPMNHNESLSRIALTVYEHIPILVGADSCLVELKSHSIGVQYWKLVNYLGPVRSWVLEEKILLALH